MSGPNYLLDIDNDGDNELLFMSKRPSPEKLIIYRSSLKESTIIDLPESKYTKHWYATIKQNGIGEHPEIVLQTDDVVYTIKYSKSKYFILKYPTYLGLYLFLFVIFWGLQKAQNVVARRNLEKEKHLMRQQMALSKRQLEPHFMLNTLNNIGYMFSKENKEDAQYYFQRFASLIHRGLKYADQTETSLFEELGFVRDYLILQQKRFNDDFEFLIESDENIDLKKIQIPHSLIYTFVENAIKHGLRLKEGDKKLEIIMSKTETKTKIEITDNGVGRKQSKSLKTTGTEKGLKIIASIVEGYNKLNNRSISYNIEDLVNDNNKGIGTVITIIT